MMIDPCRATLGASPDTGSEDARWTAIATRDAAADGNFVFSVRSTGIYCRPSCPARAARRDNIAFHATCADAERAGFRACKRCRPNEASQAERHATAVARACRLIETAETPPSLDALAQAAGLSAHHFHRIFRRLTGVTPKAYGSAHRAARMAAALPAAETITHAIYDAGYASSSRFYETAKARLGMTPTAVRNRGSGTQIRFAVGACSLGAILVATTAKGICAILIGDDPDALVRDLQDRFAEADLIGGDTAFETMVAQVVGFVEVPRRGLHLPLDIGGTAFQQRVWQALRAIPVGTTATYTEIAHAIGSPSAVRAVAGACGANAIAVAIPCHRVVRSDGSLSGYRWGVERKRTLLQREAVTPTVGA
jgi:AraC family transcriptional regulator of adaptative response/methylated-DNA-[protein]-cysteine methyltransferase